MRPNPGWPDFLIRLCHHRWSMDAAVEVARGGGARFVELQQRLGVSPVSLRSALDTLLELGLVRRNEGYGHPLRPEYLPAGARVEALGSLLALIRALGAHDLALRKWSLPVLDSLAGRSLRFGEIQAALPGITPRALIRALRDLSAADLVTREVEPGFPPAPLYSLTTTGRRVARRVARVRDSG